MVMLEAGAAAGSSVTSFLTGLDSPRIIYRSGDRNVKPRALMTKTQRQITVAAVGALGVVLAAAIALLGDHGAGNYCPADHGSSTSCVVNGR